MGNCQGVRPIPMDIQLYLIVTIRSILTHPALSQKGITAAINRPKAQPNDWSADKHISSPVDLVAMKFGLTGGTLEDLELTKLAPEGVEIVRFGTNAATQAAIISGQLDVLVSGNTLAAAISDANPEMILKPSSS